MIGKSPLDHTYPMYCSISVMKTEQVQFNNIFITTFKIKSITYWDNGFNITSDNHIELIQFFEKKQLHAPRTAVTIHSTKFLRLRKVQLIYEIKNEY